MRIILNEASNLSAYDKMQLWARGQRKENIPACNPGKLVQYGDICVDLAKRDTAYSQAYFNNAGVIVSEFRRRGLDNYANALQNSITNAKSQLNSDAGLDIFAKLAWETFSEEVKEHRADLDFYTTLGGQTQLDASRLLRTTFDDFKRALAALVRNSFIKIDKSGNFAYLSGTNLNTKIAPGDFGTRYFIFLFYITIVSSLCEVIIDKINKKTSWDKWHQSAHIDSMDSQTIYIQYDLSKSTDPQQTSTFIMYSLFWEDAMSLGLDELAARDVYIKVVINDQVEHVHYFELGSYFKNYIDSLK